MKPLITLLVLVAMLVFGASEVEACTCMAPRPPCEAYWTTEAMFRGRVDAIGPVEESGESGGKSRTVRFTVLESFKGVASASVDVKTPAGGASCGYRFAWGREYLVHAAADARGALRTSACTRTRPVDRAQDDLAYARSIAKGGSPLGRISGRVLLFTRDLLARRYRTRPLSGAVVTIRRDAFSVGARSNRAGDFAVTGLDPGSYTVSLEMEGSYRVDVHPDPVVIRDVRACAVADAGVYPDGRVSGRILDSDSRPVRGLTVDLTVPGAAGRGLSDSDPDRLRTVSRDDGTYELTDVPPGRFVLGISGRTVRELAAFHPGVVRRSEAATFIVPRGGRVSLGDFVIPATIPLVEISGVIFDSDDMPAAGARVYLRGPAERDFLLTEAVETDPSGRFSIAAIAHEYVLFAERYRLGIPHGRMDSTDPMRILPSDARAPVKLMLRRRN
jgi:hypothetical protein